MVDSKTLEAERSDYDGFHSRPMSWADVVRNWPKGHADAALREEIVQVVWNFERHDVATLMAMLARSQ